MMLLIVGLIIFFGVHILPTVPNVRDDLRSRLGDNVYKMVFSVLSLIGFAVIILGYHKMQLHPGKNRVLWDFPEWTRHIALTLMLPAMILVVAANVPSRIFAGSINAAALKASGLDFELTYRTPLHLGARDGDLTARLMASYVIDRITQARLTDAAFENAGYDGENKIRGVFNLNYAEKSWAFNIQERYIGKVHPSTNTAQGIRLYDFGDVPAVLYTDITLDAFIETNVGRVNLFATVNNLFDKQPPIYATYLVRPGVLVPGNQAVYDSVGRFFTVGARLGF